VIVGEEHQPKHESTTTMHSCCAAGGTTGLSFFRSFPRSFRWRKLRGKDSQGCACNFA